MVIQKARHQLTTSHPNSVALKVHVPTPKLASITLLGYGTEQVSVADTHLGHGTDVSQWVWCGECLSICCSVGPQTSV